MKDTLPTVISSLHYLSWPANLLQFDGCSSTRRCNRYTKQSPHHAYMNAMFRSLNYCSGHRLGCMGLSFLRTGNGKTSQLTTDFQPKVHGCYWFGFAIPMLTARVVWDTNQEFFNYPATYLECMHA